MYMDNIKQFVKTKNKLETQIQTIRIYNQDPGMKFGENNAMLIMRRRRNRTAKLRKNQNTQRKGNLQVLGSVGSRHHQTSEDE